ncbi:hypothetical protein NDU88_005811 [Pleurodeles waltl]|uniref:Uncharacterized protein n=1 Tax=Pleurodeles waltl TaxID=8319 RepID=A0AAV7TDQ2_PLEWA|nr:hypothetical protein NDU88_005811 [Pleurodeles waltl]
MEISYAMIYPARLRLQSHGLAIFFKTPQEVWSWIESQSLQDSQDPQGLQAWQMAHPKRTRWRRGEARGSPTAAEKVQRAQHRALAEVVVFARRTRSIADTSGTQLIDGDH